MVVSTGNKFWNGPAEFVFNFCLPSTSLESEKVELALLFLLEDDACRVDGVPSFCLAWKYLYFRDWKTIEFFVRY